LSLPEDVYRVILHHLSRADGGLKALLNLRETCSTTKGMIDDLQEMEASRLFSQGQAYLNMEENEDIALFLSTPPPHYIKSLRLIISNGPPKQVPILEQRDDDNWNDFVDFWKPENRGLECLQICGRWSPAAQSRIMKFMEDTKVKSIQFINDSYFSAFHNQDSILMQLETLLLDNNTTEAVSDLMERLVSLNFQLKKLQVPLPGLYMSVFNSVCKLIELRRQDLDFELTVLLHGLPNIIPHYCFPLV